MTELLATVLSVAFVAQVLRIAVPYALAAMCGAVTERSGVIDLALEAKLLFGAFAAAAFGHVTDSALAGLFAGIVAGVGVAAIQVVCALVLSVDQVIVGIALNVIAAAGTRFLLQVLFHEGANSPPCPAYGDAVLGNPIVWLAVIAAAVLPFALRRTRWGLRLRAAGDRPDAAVGSPVQAVRSCRSPWAASPRTCRRAAATSRW
jgi:ABC-type uncharacterized transport system permease subunit